MDSMGIVTVRPRRPEDDEFISKLARSSFARYSHAPSHFVLEVVREPTAKTLVSEASGMPCGFAVLSFEALGRPFGPWANPIVASLDAIAVRPDNQGRGVGRTLLEEAEKLASTSGAVTMTLRTAVSNKRAQALFRSAGFQTVAEIAKHYRRGQGAFVMTKWIPEGGLR